jgi:hypothetical protein
MLMLDCVVVKDVPVVGVQIDTVGAVAQPVLLPVLVSGLVDGGGVVVVPPPVDNVLERVTISLSVLGLPAPSYAVISIQFVPA